MKAKMKVIDLRLNIRLGCTREERSFEQPVSVSVSLEFDKIPIACKTDNIDETICYAQISEAFRAIAKKREYHLIESLAHDLNATLSSLLKGSEKKEITVHKMRPPVNDLQGGVSFSLSDFS